MSGMTDRFSSMTWEQDGPCERCGLSPNGIATYRPTHGKAISDEAVTEHLRFAGKRTPEGGAK